MLWEDLYCNEWISSYKLRNENAPIGRRGVLLGSYYGLFGNANIASHLKIRNLFVGRYV